MPADPSLRTKSQFQAQNEHRQQVLHVARDLSASLGADFFCAVVKHLGTTLRAECCLLAEVAGVPGERIKTLAVFRKRRKAENFDQMILGTAVGQVLIDGSFTCPREVRRLFPSDLLLKELEAEGFAGIQLLDTGGQPIGLLAVISKVNQTDIPLAKSMLLTFAARAASELERKRSDDVHRENEERYHAFVHANADAMWRVEFAHPIPLTATEDEQIERIFESGYLAECNAAFARMVGEATPEQLVGSTFASIVTRINSNAENELRDAVRSGFQSLTVVESTPVDAGGEHLHRLRSQFGIVKNNELLRIWGTTRDITELRRAELSLEASNRRFREVLEGIQLPAVMLDSHSNVTFCNEYFLRLVGRSKEELSALKWVGDVVPAEQANNWQATAKSHRRGAKHFEGTLVPAEGERRTIVWDTICLRDRDDKVTGTAAIGRDVTYQIALEAEVLQTQKLNSIGRVAAGLAHDFNNLLTVVLGTSSLLLERISESDPAHESLAAIHSAANSCAALTAQLLTFGRRQQLKPGSIILNDVVRDGEGMIRSVLGAGVDLVLEMASPLWPVFADPTQIQRAVVNLVMNARDAMPLGGRAIISTSNIVIVAEDPARPGVKPGPYVRLSVSDNGVGMSEDVKSHIFEPFFTTKRTGTGLGLATVYGIVTQSDGHMSVRSEERRGTTFEILLPASVIPTQK
jgi:PAS domain S-box-containing protein